MSLSQRLRIGVPVLLVLLLVVWLDTFATTSLELGMLSTETAAPELDTEDLLGIVEMFLIGVGLVILLIGWRRVFNIYFLLLISLTTYGLLENVAAMIEKLLAKNAISGIVLLRDGVIVWLTNILIFAAWYWFLDNAGRKLWDAESRHDFLFPHQSNAIKGYENWEPNLIDYVYLAFSTSTAFSPTDTVFLSTRVKVLALTQSFISLAIVTILTARAVNIIQ